MISHKELINAFIDGKTAHNGSMHTDGTKLYSYETCIAQKTSNGIIFNSCKYSITTSKQQSCTRDVLHKYDLEYTEIDNGVRRGTSNLCRYLKKSKKAA